MKKKKTAIILFLILVILVTTLYYFISIDAYGIVWRKTNYDLWISQKGKLAIRSFDVSDLTTKKEVFIDHFSDGRSLNGLIDTKTFKYVGNYFYKDKNHVYLHYDMSDGGHINIIEGADPTSFNLFGCNAKDKNSIYDQRNGKLDMVDYETFKTSSKIGCYAKDKNEFYFYGEIIDTTNADKELKKIMTKLNEL